MSKAGEFRIVGPPKKKTDRETLEALERKLQAKEEHKSKTTDPAECNKLRDEIWDLIKQINAIRTKLGKEILDASKIHDAGC